MSETGLYKQPELVRGQTTVSDWLPAPITMPEGHVEIAVGDSHGLFKTLKAVVEHALTEEPDAHLTFTGDLVSRGPQCAESLNYATTLIAERQKDGKGAFLYGNHEIALLGHMAGVKKFDAMFEKHGRWLHQGFAINRSLLVTALRSEMTQQGYDLFTRNGAMLSPKSDFFKKSMKDILYRVVGNVILVHAGLPKTLTRRKDILRYLKKMRPYEWNENHPLWLKSGFLDSPHCFDGMVIVHGHTIESKIEDQAFTNGRKPVGHHVFDKFRIGIDGGSYLTGVVCGVILKNGFYKTVVSEGYDRA